VNHSFKIIMKIVEYILEKIIREHVVIDDMQFGSVPGRGTTDAIFILCQPQEKHLTKNVTSHSSPLSALVEYASTLMSGSSTWLKPCMKELSQVLK